MGGNSDECGEKLYFFFFLSERLNAFEDGTEAGWFSTEIENELRPAGF